MLWCIFWICVKGNVNSRSKIVMIMVTFSRQTFNVLGRHYEAGFMLSDVTSGLTLGFQSYEGGVLVTSLNHCGNLRWTPKAEHKRCNLSRFLPQTNFGQPIQAVTRLKHQCLFFPHCACLKWKLRLSVNTKRHWCKNTEAPPLRLPESCALSAQRTVCSSSTAAQ